MPNEKQRFWGGFFHTYPGMGHGWKRSLVSLLVAWLCTASAPCAGPSSQPVAAAGDVAAVLPCLQPPAPCPSALLPGCAWEAAARALGSFQPGGGVGQSLSHAAFRLDIKHSSDVELSVLWGVVTQLHSRFKGSFSRGNCLFPC